MNQELNPMSKQVLIIEDQKELASLIENDLKKIGISSKKIHDGRQGFNEAVTGEYLLIILDIILPYKSGIEILKQLRQAKVSTPIIVLSTRNTVENVVDGFTLGADDYVPKPFRMEELRARVEALLRRTKGSYSNKLTYKDLIIDLESKTVRKAGKEIKLSPTMYKILVLLVKSKGNIVERDDIINKVWGDKNTPSSGTIDVHINAIRNLLDSENRDRYIKTAHGAGYMTDK